MGIAARHYIIAFWLTLAVSLILLITGFFLPPQGEISPSVLTATGEIFLWPALAFGAKALEEGKTAKIRRGDSEISIGDNEKMEGLD